jgi:hypothetical protein
MLAERREKHFTKTEHALNSHRESWTLVQDCLMHHPLHFFFILNDPSSVFDLTPPLRVPPGVRFRGSGFRREVEPARGVPWHAARSRPVIRQQEVTKSKVESRPVRFVGIGTTLVHLCGIRTESDSRLRGIENKVRWGSERVIRPESLRQWFILSPVYTLYSSRVHITPQ